MTAKNEYHEPSVTIHGSVEEITRQGNAPSSDVPAGNDNTAYSPG